MSGPLKHALTNRSAGEVIARRGGRDVPLEEFLGHASALAAMLPRKPHVLNLCRDRYEFLVGFCAAVIAGQCTLMPPNRQPQTLLDVATDFEGTYVIGRERIAGLECIEPDQMGDIKSIPEAPLINDEQLCAVVFTSGSTGKSRPNYKYWRTLREGSLTNINLVLDGQNLNIVATVPSQHMWGFEMSILLPLFAPVTISNQVPFFPQDILDVLHATPRPRALVSSPVHLAALLESTVDPICIDRIYTATAPMSSERAAELEARFDARLIDVFGCSESGILAARHLSDTDLWQLAEAFSLEQTANGTLVTADHLDETVRLNDQIELLGDKCFRWIGRDQDMINIAGKRGSLAGLNEIINAIPGVTDAVVFSPQDDAKRLAALVVAPDLRSAEILSALRNRMEPAFLPRPLYIVSALPREETGKLPRKAILDMFEKLSRRGPAPRDDAEDDKKTH